MDYGCIGERLTHSFSKEIHALLSEYSYELSEIDKESLAQFFAKKDFNAVNVTIPYKQEVIRYLDEIDDAAKSIGAVNTVVNRKGRLFGYNTDFSGMRALIEKNGIEIREKKVLILGSGGTAKTAFAVSSSLGASEIFCVSRSAQNGCISYEEAVKNHSDAQIIINTTPVGMFPNIGNSAVNIADFRLLCGIVDAVYNPLRSALVTEGKKRGIKSVGGLYMLVAQAAFASELFTDSNTVTEKIDMVFKKILHNKENVVLTGMPGCGKTTIGQILAKNLSMEFIDTDEEIVRLENRSINDIFATDGEEYFRKTESQVIKNIATRQHVVISTGGGTVLSQRNCDLLSENGRLFFLDRPLQNIIVTSDRPLSSTREALIKQYNERYKIYCDTADCIVKCDGSINAAVLSAEEFFNEDFSD